MTVSTDLFPSALLPATGEATVDACGSLDELAALIHDQRAASYRAEVALLAGAAKWAGMAEPTSLFPDMTGDRGLQLGGEGIEPCSEYAPDEFGALMGISTDSARQYMAEALELQLRLPRTWRRIALGEVAPWKGRMIARETGRLSAAAAAYVDEHVSWCAERITPSQLARSIAAAIALFDPEKVDGPQASDPRHFDIHTRDHSSDGLVEVNGHIDVADAIDLDNAIGRRVSNLRDLGATAERDVLRAWAVGDIARNDLALDLVATEGADGSALAEPIVTEAQAPTSLRVHVMGSELEAHMAGDDEDVALVRVENTRGFMTLDALHAWLSRGRGQVKVTPVIDTDANLHLTRYEIPDRLRRQVIERDPCCVFPWCGRPADRADLDHIDAYDSGGATSPDNLAPLCRHHHRAKTHGGWTYSQVEPAVYLWRSPTGMTWLRDRTGTRRT
jgi:hypothetical protein